MDFIERVKNKAVKENVCPVGWKYKEFEIELGFIDKDFERFCEPGCSIECDKFYQEYLIRKYKKMKKRG